MHRLAIVGGVLAVAVACDGLSDEGACPDGVRAGDVEEYFETEGAALTGGDYQRAHRLDDNRVLWTFQDAVVGGEFAHNAGVIQEGDCWTALNTPDGRAWLLPDQTENRVHWYWPLGSELSPDGSLLGLLLAEMTEHGDEYLDQVEPLGVQLVVLDVATLEVRQVVAPPLAGPELYGWSVASDDDHTYLYGWCARQMGWSDSGHDTSCTPNVYVARVPRGELTAPPEIWDGANWQADPAAAASVVDPARGDVLPIQVRYDDGTFLAVGHAGDWYGDTVFVDRSDSPTGPWEQIGEVGVEPRCPAEECNTYFASFTPNPGEVAVSNNTWDGATAEDHAVYHPAVLDIPTG